MSRARPIRCAITTAIPVTSRSRSSISPVCSPARRVMPWFAAASRSAAAQCTARAGPSKVARMPSPSCLTTRPRYSATIWLMVWSWSSRNSTPGIVAAGSELFGGGDDVGEQDRRQDPIVCDDRLGFSQEPFDLGKDRGRIPQEELVLGAGQLDKSRPRDPTSRGPARLHVNEPVVAAVQHERRHAHRRQDRFHIDVRGKLQVSQRQPGARGQTPSPTPPLPQHRIMSNTRVLELQALDPGLRPGKQPALVSRHADDLGKRRPKMGHDQRPDPLRIRRREHHPRDTDGHVEERGAIRTGRVQYGQRIVAGSLQRGRTRIGERVGRTGTRRVVHDYPGELTQSLHE